MIRGSRAVTSCIWIPCSLAAVMGTPGSLRGAQVRSAGLIPPAATRSSNDSAGRGPRAARLAGWAGAADNADQAGLWELSWRACLRRLNPWWCQTRRLSKWGEKSLIPWTNISTWRFCALCICWFHYPVAVTGAAGDISSVPFLTSSWWCGFQAFLTYLYYCLLQRLEFPWVNIRC